VLSNVEANVVGIFVFDVEGPILQANDTFLKTVGYSHDDLASGRLSWIGLTPPDWRDRDKRELQAIGILQSFEKEYFRKDGSRVPVLIGVARFEEGGRKGVAFVLDLTERKRAEEALRNMQSELAHANRVITMGHLTASIAHEVKQPITAAVANASAALRWLEARPPNLEEGRRVLAEIVETGLRAGDVIGRIQALVRKAPPCKQPFDFNEAVLDVLAMTRTEARNQDVSLYTDLAPNLPPVEGDRTQLQQVLLNLLSNAMEAMSGNGEERRELKIGTEIGAGSRVLVTVEDSGRGFEPAHVGRVFDAFYTTKSGGMGVGLWISRSIIEGHGGRLWANVNSPRGAVFQFTIPLHAAGKTGEEA
jgi:PAS domain S-box-containing protein